MEVPGSKSLTNRALLLAALSDGPSTVSGALRARDTLLMGRALASLGTSVEGLDHDGPVRVVPSALHGPAHVDCGLAGTVMRFVPPVAGLADGDIRFDGDPRARVRPMDVVIGSLEQLGVEVDDDGRGTLPFPVKGSGAVRGGVVEVDAAEVDSVLHGARVVSAYAGPSPVGVVAPDGRILSLAEPTDGHLVPLVVFS